MLDVHLNTKARSRPCERAATAVLHHRCSVVGDGTLTEASPRSRRLILAGCSRRPGLLTQRCRICDMRPTPWQPLSSLTLTCRRHGMVGSFRCRGGSKEEVARDLADKAANGIRGLPCAIAPKLRSDKGAAIVKQMRKLCAKLGLSHPWMRKRVKRPGDDVLAPILAKLELLLGIEPPPKGDASNAQWGVSGVLRRHRQRVLR